ncbi:hypothetical protein VMCG_05782 [Cytospora schulzeri]|uniref:Uncharacterized protein n=1 Tax=Cytospora schulzeri TaxID=448051 RepID=A0A423WIB1_9PEZI|nr:hypothetical protein VMCG_05782 [Valsa malicola]
MASPVVIAVSVSPIRSEHSTPARRRQLTPSIEVSTHKRSLVLTTPNQKPANLAIGATFPVQTYFAPKQLFPEGVASVQDALQYTHAHPPRPDIPGHLQGAGRHVLLPVDLRDPAVDPEGEDVRPMLYNVFPGVLNVNVGRKRSFLNFQVEKLPQQPWPLTVGGLPITIADFTRGRVMLFPKQRLSPSKINICPEFQDQDLSSGTVLRQLTIMVHDEFKRTCPQVRLLELIYATDGALYAILAGVNVDSVLANLPAKFANRFVGYLRDSDLRRPRWVDLPAKRLITPQHTQGIIDDTPYDTLRPGVIICSRAQEDHAHPGWYSTTSGVLVEDPAGNRFMTAASHGIDNEEIWQLGSVSARRSLGEAVQEISFTDVSLVQLRQGVEFVNETFENSAGEVPRFTRLFGEDPSDKLGDGNCYLNSPYTGDMEGVIVMTSVKIEASSHPSDIALRYVVYDWAYLGQEEGATDRARPPNGTCGSAIWNDDGVVLDFYRYYLQEGPFAGFAVAVSASEVVKAGYRLAK